MKKWLSFFVAFIAIILFGILIQSTSGQLFPENVLLIEEVTVNPSENTQEITGHQLNQRESITLQEVYHNSESVAPLYQEGEQLLIRRQGDGWTILALKRDGYVFVLVGIFAWIVLLITGKKGMYALLGFVINSVLLLLFLWLNQWNRQFELPIMMSIYTIIAVIVAMGTSYGFKTMDIRKVVGTLLSVFIAFFICVIAMDLMNDSGLRYEEMQFITRPYRSVFLGGLLIGAIGASMDNIVTIISSLDEIKAKNRQLTTKQLLFSGQEIAKDTASSMVNVLMFAYLSGAVPSFVFYSANGWSFFETLNMHLSLEILRSLCGGFAIVLSVPIALLAFLVSEKLKERRDLL